jgi:hypothetical protein
MKNTPKIGYRIVGGILLPFMMTVAGLTLTGCPQEPNSEDSKTINDFFGVSGVTVTVKGGTFTNSEITALNTAYDNSASNLNKVLIQQAFNNATITVVRETATWTYKTVAGSPKAITINANGLSGLTGAKLFEAAQAMGTNAQG